jgi:predicted NBD/HSP70 family sugar kinase/predicted transcriptional regulator
MTPPADGQQAAKPSLDLLRSLTDEHVLRAVMDHGRLTRAEIAAQTGISKPTVSESARRLSAAGVLVDTGERTTGRGRSGSYYTLTDAVGTALVATMRPEAVTAESLDPFGTTRGEAVVPLELGAGPDAVAAALAEAARRVMPNADPFRLAVLSAADPVDRSTGRLVALPDAPFMVGDLDPVAVLTPLVSGVITIDNDVNWSARAERQAGATRSDNFVYLHLGEGLGCAVMGNGEVNRGHRGLAGEIAHVVTIGPGGRATRLTEVFAALDLRRPGSAAIDVDRLRGAYGQVGSDGVTTLETVAQAVGGLIVAAIALADPEEVVLGGSWGRERLFVEALDGWLASAPRAVPIRAASTETPDHAGARMEALAALRTSIAASGAHREPTSQIPRTRRANRSPSAQS